MNSRLDHPTTSVKPSAGTHDADRLIMTLALLSLAMLTLVTQHARRRPAPDAQQAATIAIDPNVAPWWELTVLPNIGPTLASEIVRHREFHNSANPADTARVFAKPADLANVRGIGPKTVEGIKGNLSFDGD